MDSASHPSFAPIADADVAQIVALWERCALTRPWNDPAADIALTRRDQNATVLVGRVAGEIVGSVMVGHDGHRGWVYYVSVDPDHRGSGYGRAIMAAAEDWLRARGIPKLQLLVRRANAKVQAFYETLDFAEQETIVYGKWLDGRDPTP
jgi:ribosomal protein S18 acetylase RimI-like enzyme